MKKVLLLLVSALFLSGCGGGGGTTTSAGNSAGGGSIGIINGPTGTITVNFVQPVTTTAANSMRFLAANATLPAANFVRVLVRSFSTDDIGTVTVRFSRIVDVDLTTGANSASATVPAGPDYAVEVVSALSPDHGVHNRLLKYGNIAGINVTSGVNSAVSITLAKINTTLAVPATVPNGTAYALTVSNLAFPLGNSNFYRTATSAFTDNLFTTGTPLTSAGIFLTAETIANATDPSVSHYFQALFSIDSAFLNASEVAANWTYYYPDLSLTPADPSVTTTVQPPGNLPISITL